MIIGLDTVELVMQFEEEFDVAIHDAMACGMIDISRTVRGVVKLLAEKQTPPVLCSTAHAFCRFRHDLMTRFSTPRSMIRLDVPIGMLVPPSQEGQWKQIAESSALRCSGANRRFPKPGFTVREVLKRRAKREWRSADGLIDESAIFHRVREIVSEQLGVPINQLFGDTRYIQDLGAA